MPVPAATAAQRLTRQAWRALHQDADRARALAQQAAERAARQGDALGAAWAEMVLAFHQLYFDTPTRAAERLLAVALQLQALGDRGGAILARTGQARALWRGGQAAAAMALLQPLRDEGLRLLPPAQRAVLLNAIAGCYSAQGQSEQAFAYMYQALRDAGPTRGDGFDAVLHCNLSHELLQLGDEAQALACIERGLERCQGLHNPRLRAVLLINRVLALTALGRASEALEAAHQVAAMPRDASGRGLVAPHHESLALAALAAGDHAWAAQLLHQAEGEVRLPDERMELALGKAQLAQVRGHNAQALATLAACKPLLDGQGDAAVCLRLRVAHALLRAELHEHLGDAPAALGALREAQALQTERGRQAASARYQAAALQTELTDLRHRLALGEERRRAAERERAALALANAELSRRMAEVQALQVALREQAIHDALTGLPNRRHLNDSLPATVALALRDAQPLAVAVIDLDHFKRVNDEHGHPAGDRLLAAFGALLRAHLRRSDLAFRYGGEEFCLLLPHTPASDARAKLQQLLAAWQAQGHALDDGPTLHGQSFSAGVTDTLHAPASPASLLRAADQLLLLAKRGGRARVLAPGGEAQDEPADGP